MPARSGAAWFGVWHVTQGAGCHHRAAAQDGAHTWTRYWAGGIDSAGPTGEGAVEVEGGTDERQVREGLREVAEGLAAGPRLLGVQPEVVAVAQHLLEQQTGLGQTGRVGLSG